MPFAIFDDQTRKSVLEPIFDLAIEVLRENEEIPQFLESFDFKGLYKKPSIAELRYMKKKDAAAIIRTYITVDEDRLSDAWQRNRKEFFAFLYYCLLHELLHCLNGRKVPEEEIEARALELAKKPKTVKDKNLSKKLAKILGLKGR